MSVFDRLKKWLETTLQREQEELSRKKLFFLRQLQLLVYVGREIAGGEYPYRAAALVLATLLAIVPIFTVSFSFFRAFGGLQEGDIQQRVREELTDFLLGDIVVEVGDEADPEGEEADPEDEVAEEDAGGPARAAGEGPDEDGVADAPLFADEAPLDDEPDDAEEPVDELAERRRLIMEWSRQISDTIAELAEKASGPRMHAVSVVFLVFSAVTLFNTIEKTFNRIWRVRSRRSFWVKFPVFFTILILGPVLVAAGVFVASQLSPADYMQNVTPHGRPFLARLYSVLMTTLALFLAYKLLPFTSVRWRPALTGALMAAIGWELAKWGFGLYIRRSFTYARLYGSLATIPIFLLWLYLTWMIVLFGAGLSYVTQNIETITETEKPSLTPLSDRLAIAVMLAVGLRFEKGEKPATVQRLSEELNARPEDVQQVAEELAAANFLATPCEEAEYPVLPARPLDTLAIDDILARIRRVNAEVFRPGGEAQGQVLGELFSQMEQRGDEFAHGITVRDLVGKLIAAEGGKGAA